MKRSANKSKPPSRVRYEQEHPTVSIRLNRALRDKLDEIRELEGKSHAEIVRETIETRIRADEAFGRAFADGLKGGEAEGYEQGFREGRSRGKSEGYKRGRAEGEAAIRRQLTLVVTLPCRECGGRRAWEYEGSALVLDATTGHK